MLLVIRDPTRGWVLRSPTLREWLLCRAQGHRLDRALAAGTPPESDAVLCLRAHLDVAAGRRAAVARALRRLVRDATQPPRYVHHGSPTLQRVRIRKARGELELLIRRLESPGPLPAAGMAKVHLLLCDGGGPLYYAGARSDLQRLLDEALQTLDAPLTS